MSADAFIAYFGLRFEIGDAEIESVERRSDRRMRAARSVGLSCYYGSFDAGGGSYRLLIGAELGIFGAENEVETSIAADGMRELMEDTRRKLREAGLAGMPAIHLIWQPDA